VLAAARRFGWGSVLLVSFAVWATAQFGPGIHLPGQLSGRLPLHSGPFDLRAWQLLWVGGLALGQGSVKGTLLNGARRHWSALAAGSVVMVGLLSRHGALPTPADCYLYMDKWSLGPLRMLNFGAWVVLLLAWNPRLPAGLLAAPALLGRQSLAVFSAHLPLVIAASCLIELVTVMPAVQAGIGLLVISALFPVALWKDRKAKGPPDSATPADIAPALVRDIEADRTGWRWVAGESLDSVRL